MLFRKLGRRSEHRLAMLRQQVTSLIKHGAITTTLPKAKELRRVSDWMVTWAKRGYVEPGTKADYDGVKYRRLAGAWVQEKDALHDLFTEMPIRFATRKGGYTRILKLGFRRGDAAPMARIEWVEYDKGRDEDRQRFEAARRDRDERQAAVRAEVADALRKHRHAFGMAALRDLGRLAHKAENKKDTKALRLLSAKVQSKMDRAKSNPGFVASQAADDFARHQDQKKALVGVELPSAYGFVKVARNLYNRYGGRGLVKAHKDKNKDA